MIQLKAKLPKCWRELVHLEFTRADGGLFTETGVLVTSEHNQKGNADPEPHYDDYRLVEQVSNGYTLHLELCSGQNNYFGGCSIFNEAGDVLYEETWDRFDSKNLVIGYEGEQFDIQIEWE